MSLLGRAHGRLQQVLYRDLVPESLVEQPLPGRQLAVGQDLNLWKQKPGSELTLSITYAWMEISSPQTFYTC